MATAGQQEGYPTWHSFFFACFPLANPASVVSVCLFALSLSLFACGAVGKKYDTIPSWS
jgi:hypothetical protein